MWGGFFGDPGVTEQQPITPSNWSSAPGIASDLVVHARVMKILALNRPCARTSTKFCDVFEPLRTIGRICGEEARPRTPAELRHGAMHVPITQRRDQRAAAALSNKPTRQLEFTYRLLVPELSPHGSGLAIQKFFLRVVKKTEPICSHFSPDATLSEPGLVITNIFAFS